MITAHFPKHDPVNSPKHYQGNGIECIDAIEAALTPEEFRGYCKGNALKYLWREKYKGGVEDTLKANWYLNRLNKLSVAQEPEAPELTGAAAALVDRADALEAE